MNVEDYVFEPLPDGKYMVRYVRDFGVEDQFILGIYQVSYGEFQGKLVPMLFTGRDAREITREGFPSAPRI